ncbi:MAG: xanthine dehydrogenase small subunit [Alphaproteobacteria bacterium]|nr:xanthine dehydrogenase small subunit [Alphaproteobacteria bacterium]
MTAPRREIRLLLNDREVTCSDVGPHDMLLDFLRTDMRLSGTKEGCAEGDCGACTVLVGALRHGELEYGPVTACIRLLATVDSCQVVTVEHLASDDRLHPVQEAMVESHASQCGFCTPGFVMALCALWLRTPSPTRSEVEVALQGNLCRCTGYRPIVEAALRAGRGDGDPLTTTRDAVRRRLAELRDGRRVELERDGSRVLVPANVDDLARLLEQETDPVLVAGATDVGVEVNRQLRPISPAICIGHLDELAAIEREDRAIVLGAAVTWEEAGRALVEAIPSLRDFWERVGGPQIRTMGTVGGNVANGSPVGDLPPVLLALGAEIGLRSGRGCRTVGIDAFFLGYGRQDIRSGEFLERIRVCLPKPGARLGFYKVSKRRDQDIAAVAGAFNLQLDGDTVTCARLAFGGMAAVPSRASAAEAACTGRPWRAQTMQAAGEALDRDFTPISDLRGSAGYRSLVARNLLVRFYLENSEPGVPVRLEQVR